MDECQVSFSLRSVTHSPFLFNFSLLFDPFPSSSFPSSASFEAGRGGWPTVRYFNAETGYNGAPYAQKTSRSMCDELGDLEYMRAYVEEKSVPPCDVATLAGCDARETGFVQTWRDQRSATQRESELRRLEKIGQTLNAKPEVMRWHKQREAILKRIQQLPPAAEQKNEL